MRGRQGAIQFEKGRDAVGPSSMAPCSGLPEVIRGGVGEVVVRPAPLGLGDGAPERFENVVTRHASGGGGNSCEGGLAVYIPPPKTLRVGRVPTFKQPPRDSINVRVEGICSAGEGVNVRNVRSR